MKHASSWKCLLWCQEKIAVDTARKAHIYKGLSPNLHNDPKVCRSSVGHHGGACASSSLGTWLQCGHINAGETESILWSLLFLPAYGVCYLSHKENWKQWAFLPPVVFLSFTQGPEHIRTKATEVQGCESCWLPLETWKLRLEHPFFNLLS